MAGAEASAFRTFIAAVHKLRSLAHNTVQTEDYQRWNSIVDKYLLSLPEHTALKRLRIFLEFNNIFL